MTDSTHGPNAVRDVVGADRELALLRELIQAASSGPGVEPLAAAAARMITAATGTDVCFVHVLDDTDRSLTLAGRPHRSTARWERSDCRWVPAFQAGWPGIGSRW
ncbi:sensor histidine kinase domain protein [Mycobacterium xenopi 4042]|uniref:Sensor histidine kinase domain protein n=1 Tax=Mycobacterium xenopi 4042 TaxID=1299334 RepID=X7YL65_MYCXE|nr:sensor histidine kinase domain protein [Mycobacterium xenopi 4042]